MPVTAAGNPTGNPARTASMGGGMGMGGMAMMPAPGSAGLRRVSSQPQLGPGGMNLGMGNINLGGGGNLGMGNMGLHGGGGMGGMGNGGMGMPFQAVLDLYQDTCDSR
ncbi:hypothetical protein BT96DRAFT_290548 [Gymnopus androsaceus JB14]|uniref:Uncharacterized protein n=1 Tax=Gymnopus androsaceus JB14 TaxID=1447944 RepID=A0A6A4H4B3_9AGAR|nr:hypothetical protein BT96DRAFT_290548 [Gymnopus androsaceus JB14]